MPESCGKMCTAYDYELPGMCADLCVKQQGHLEAPHRCARHLKKPR